jgi:glycosyltransferase involved in cell wall biosynthesis
VAPLTRNVLVDVAAASTSHRARGIGRYVRGIVSSIEHFPNGQKDLVWGVGIKGPTLRQLGDQGIPSHLIGLRPMDAGAILGTIALRKAARLTRAGAFHATDPYRPWLTRSVRQAVTVYDLIPLRTPRRLASWRANQRWTYRRYLEQVRSAAVVVAISRATAQDLQDLLGVPEQRIAIVKPVVAVARHYARSPSSAEPVFLTVGALDPHKRPWLAVEAFARFRAREHAGTLRMIGPSTDAQRAEVLEVARRNKVESWVELVGRVSDAELDAAYATATALLFTSQIEGFGLPPVEAAMRGVPVIAVDIPSSRETVGDAATLVPEDPEALAIEMERPRDPTVETQARLRAEYSAQAVGEQLLAVYQRVSS